METEISTSESIIEKAKISEAAGASAFMNPEPKKAKGKPGRPKGSASSSTAKGTNGTSTTAHADDTKKDVPPQFQIETKLFCYPIVKGISVLSVNYTKVKETAMTPDEAEGIASSLGMVLDKYMPDAMKNYGPEMMLAFSLGMYGARVYSIKKAFEAHMARNTPPKTAESNPRPQEHVNNDLAGNESSVVP